MTEVALFVLISKTAKRSDKCISNSVRYMHPYAMLNVVKYCIKKRICSCGTLNSEMICLFFLYILCIRLCIFLPTTRWGIETTIFKTSAKL